MKPLNDLTEDSFQAAVDAMIKGNPKPFARIIKGLPTAYWESGLKRHPGRVTDALCHAVGMKLGQNEIRANTKAWRASIRTKKENAR